MVAEKIRSRGEAESMLAEMVANNPGVEVILLEDDLGNRHVWNEPIYKLKKVFVDEYLFDNPYLFLRHNPVYNTFPATWDIGEYFFPGETLTEEEQEEQIESMPWKYAIFAVVSEVVWG